MPTTAPEILDVLIVGAGISGIGAARHLQKKCPDKTWRIVEARERLGGTWDLFRYPGIRSDSDMNTLGYAFKPWTANKAIADGSTILRYLAEAANETGVAQNILYQHAVRSAHWSSEHAYWTVEVSFQDAPTLVQFKARFLYLCCGYYSYKQGHQPTFKGQEEFKGQLIYPQFWPQDLSYQDKRVVVIGSGATAITLVPELAKTAAHVTMLQRSPTYVISLAERDALSLWLARFLPQTVAYAVTRWKNVLLGSIFFQLSRRKPEMIKSLITWMATKQLGAKVDVKKHFTPSYKPWDQRMCVIPNGDLFKTLRKGKASVVTETIECFTHKGLQLTNGEELSADSVVCATGLTLNFLGDMVFTVDQKPVDFSKAIIYQGMMLSDLPNAIVAIGYTNLSWTLKADLTSQYACRLIKYMDRHGYTTAMAKGDPQVKPQNFMPFNSGYVQRASEYLPKQGDRKPWQVAPYYWLDIAVLRWGRLDDGVMTFSKSTAFHTKEFSA